MRTKRQQERDKPTARKGRPTEKKKTGADAVLPWLPVHWTSAVLGNAMIFGVMISSVIIMTFHREVYYVHVQEDKIIEWMSF